jgi:diguanylate cyclase (GGDEF)-like protein
MTYFKALQSSAEEYLFVVDLDSNMILLSDNFMKDFDFPSNMVDDLDNLLMPFIYHEDREIFEDAMKNILTEDKGKSATCEFRLLHSNGDYGWVSLKMTVGADEYDERPEFLCGVIKRLDEIVRADYVTGLLRRNVFYSDLTDELEKPNAHGAVIVITLDNFNVITETYGHKFGDGALRQIAQNITNVLPPDIRLYKLDGYSFGLFMPDAMPEEIEIIFASVQLCMREIRNVEDTIYCTASAGAAFYPNDANDVTTLMRYAEVALEIARQKGRDQITFFEKETYDRWRYDIGMQNTMQNCIARGCEDFFLCYQPQVDAKDGRLLGAEALLRWYDDDGSVVAPMQFIPMLEKSRMIIPVGHWIIENAVIMAKKWQQYMPDFQMSINISLYQLEERMFYPFVEDCIARHQIDPHTITFELTETQNVYDWEFVNKQFSAFHDLGIQIAMDDFGSGYSNLAFLKNFRCNIIKIDRAFIEDILTSNFDQNLIRYVTMLCHSIGMQVVIEGVEDEETYKFLRDECHVDQIQGFYFGYPEMEDVFVKRFKK